MIRFAPASSADINPICLLNEELIGMYEDPDSIDLAAALAWVRRKVAKLLPEYRAVFRGDEKIAYFHLSATDDGFLELDDLYVLPGFRNQGVGTQIIQHCIGESERLSLPLMLCVFAENTRAVALYERMGFSISETISPTRLIMQRALRGG